MTARALLPRTLALAAAGALGAGVALGVAGGVGALGSSTKTTIVQSAAPPETVSSAFARKGGAMTVGQIYRQLAPGVVQITATSEVQVPADPFLNPFGAPLVQQEKALGSGFVIDKAGHIVTNYHVIAGARSVQVSFSDNESMRATIVGSDPSTDIAVLRVNASSRALTPLTFGDSDQVQVGDQVVAIGNPFGLSRTVTAGIVSALQRQISSPNQYTIDHVIQTDAAINHGNSGGPLIDSRGEVIGVNAQIDTGNTGQQGNVGIGFAIPSNTVRTVVAQLMRNGRVEHAFLGVSLQAVTPELAKIFALPAKSGVLVDSVERGSAAAKAGLKGGTVQVTVSGESYRLGGDLIVSADGRPVSSLAQIRDLVSAKKPGDTLTLVVYRGHSTTRKTIEVKLGRQPTSPSG